MNEKMIEELKTLAAKSTWEELSEKDGDEFFNPDDYAGGNIDDAYSGGKRDGEIDHDHNLLYDGLIKPQRFAMLKNGVVFAQSPWSPGEINQCVGRTHRLGQDASNSMKKISPQYDNLRYRVAFNGKMQREAILWCINNFVGAWTYLATSQPATPYPTLLFLFRYEEDATQFALVWT